MRVFALAALLTTLAACESSHYYRNVPREKAAACQPEYCLSSTPYSRRTDDRVPCSLLKSDAAGRYRSSCQR
jgi:hypothetical protein